MTTLISIWGKGGTGKSTCASALAYAFAQHGKRTLLITTDLIPTVSKIFGVEGEGEIQLSNVPFLTIYELSPDDVVEKWKKRFGEEVYEVVSSIIPVGKEVLDYIAGAPGLADEFMLYVIYEKWKENRYDFIIWDLPAAGDALRLLWLEKQFYTHLGDAAKMYLRLKGYLSKLKRKKGPTPIQLIEEWRELANNILSMLACEMHKAMIVTTPENLSIEVAKRIIRDLRFFQVDIYAIIVNMILPNQTGLRELFSEKLRMQARNIDVIKDIARRENLICVEIPLLNLNLADYRNLNEVCKSLSIIMRGFLERC